MSQVSVSKGEVRFVKISASKVRRVCNLIRGKSVDEAFFILKAIPQRPAYIVLKLLRSVVANADRQRALVISQLCVNEGPSVRRFRPRARGRVNSEVRRSCHIVLEVQ